jgi:hypothetical protein
MNDTSNNIVKCIISQRSPKAAPNTADWLNLLVV